MDHYHFLNQIRDQKNLERAYYYALNDRLNNDYYFDLFEILFVKNNKESILKEIEKELQNPEKYIPRASYAYYLPKSELCYRRMIYIPFKDLIVRYAITQILTEYVDSELSDHCFANRKATGDNSKERLLDIYHKGPWQNFCKWQKDCSERYSVLLRTDISSFYDSISHEYLLRIIGAELNLPVDCEVMLILKKSLQLPIISYSNFEKVPKLSNDNKQGLATGNTTDGFLANLYLKNIDDLMEKIPNIEFGRYNDDMRIFGNNRKEVMDAVLTLQQYLLAQGLNLNSSKTLIAENKVEVENLRSKMYESYYFQHFEIEANETKSTENNLINNVDTNFDEFHRMFDEDSTITNGNDAKDFCKFLTNTQLNPIINRTPQHINRLNEIIHKYQSSGKHAGWLLIQSAFWASVPKEAQNYARSLLFQALEDDSVNSYVKYRMLHHLVKTPQFENNKKYLDMLNKSELERLINLLPSLLQQPAFELNITGLYILNLLGHSESEIQDYVKKYIPKPVGDPIKNAMSIIREPIEFHKSMALEECEPDAIPGIY